MAAVFEKPSLLRRFAPLFEGFDGPLAFAVFLLACAGLLIMYSSGYDHGTRFVDHSRNMLIAGGIMFVVAQIPPQRLMADQKRCQALDQPGGGHSAQRDHEDRHATHAGLVVSKA
jgi:hypothetical protein